MKATMPCVFLPRHSMVQDGTSQLERGKGGLCSLRARHILHNSLVRTRTGWNIDKPWERRKLVCILGSHAFNQEFHCYRKRVPVRYGPIGSLCSSEKVRPLGESSAKISSTIGKSLGIFQFLPSFIKFIQLYNCMYVL